MNKSLIVNCSVFVSLFMSVSSLTLHFYKSLENSHAVVDGAAIYSNAVRKVADENHSTQKLNKLATIIKNVIESEVEKYSKNGSVIIFDKKCVISPSKDLTEDIWNSIDSSLKEAK